MANDNHIKTVIDILKGDASGIKAIKDAEKAQQALAEAMTGGNRAAALEADKAAAAIAEIGDAGKESARSLSSIYEEMRRSADAIETGTNEMQAFNDSVREGIGNVKELASESRNVKPGENGFGKDQVGDISTASGAIGSALGAIGGSSGQAAGQLVGDVTGAIEYLPALKNAVVDFATATGPLGAVVAGVAVGIGVAVAQILSSQKELDAQAAAAIKANADIERQIASGLTLEDAKAKIDELNKQREAELQIIDREKGARQAAANAANSQFGVLGGAVTAFVNATSNAEETSAQVQAEAEENARKYQAEIDRLNKAIGSGELVGNTAAVTFENLNTGLQGVVPNGLNFASAIDSIAGSLGVTADTAGNVGSAINDFITGGLGALNTGLQTGVGALTAISEAEKAREAILRQAQDAINKAADAEAALAAKRALNDSRAAEDAAITAKRAGAAQAAALAEAKAAETAKLVQIAQQGADKVADLQAQLAEGIDNYYQQISDEDAAYQSQTLKEEADFHRQQHRERRDYQKEIEKIERDSRASQLDALLNNDFGAIIAAQQEEATQKADSKDAFKTARQDAQEDFAIQQAQEAEAHAAKIAAIQTELAEFQNATAQKIAQTQAETAAALAAQQQTFDDQQAKEAAKRALAEQYAAEDAALKAKRLAEDRAAEDAAAQAKLVADLARITEKADAETAAQVKVLEAVQGVDTAIVNVIQKAQQLAQSAATAANGDTTGGAATVTKFANEGIRDKPTPAVIGDVPGGYAEAVVKFKKSEGLGQSLARRSGGGGGGNMFAPTINLNNAVIADVVGVEAVRNMIVEAGDQLNEMWIQTQQLAVTGARSQKGNR